MEYKVEAIVKKIDTPIICVMDGKETVYPNGVSLYDQFFDKCYRIDKILVKDGNVVLFMSESKYFELTNRTGERLSTDSAANLDVDWIKKQKRNDTYHIEKGLPNDMFLFVSSVTPLVNVDLLVRDLSGRILLAWRNDKLSGRGWHIPGGIIRHMETIEQRLQKTAQRELGATVDFKGIIKVSEIHLDQIERGHFISLLCECGLPDNYSIDTVNAEKNECTVGYLRWFDKYPTDGIVYSQHVYEDYLTSLFNMKRPGGVKSN